VVAQEPFDRRLLGLGMGAGVGNQLGPRREEIVEFFEAFDAPVLHLGDEGLADVEVQSFLLAPTLRGV